MSISDLIVVMKDGVVQQIGKPQDGLRLSREPFCGQISGHAAHQRL